MLDIEDICRVQSQRVDVHLMHFSAIIHYGITPNLSITFLNLVYNSNWQIAHSLTILRSLFFPSLQVDSDSSNTDSHSKALYLEKVRESSEAVNRGDFLRAVQLYSEAIQLDSSNHILHTNRSAAYAKLGQHQASLDDARQARQINPKWSKVGKFCLYMCAT